MPDTQPARVATTRSDLIRVLKEQFGHDRFRPGQERVMRALLDGRDVLAVLPTGAGKSLVYQLTAQLLPGVALVVSPLLALMKDQVESLRELGIDVGAVSSAQTQGEAAEALNDARQGSAKLLYVTPERFEDPEFLAEMKRLQVSLFVVDEAHSISEWGHSFRSAYLRLGSAIDALGLPRPVVLALTATATPWVRRDIAERLNLRDPLIEVRGVDRPNLFFQVERVEDERDDRRVLQLLLSDPLPEGGASYLGSETLQGPGIVYVATTRAAEETATWLQEWGIAADYYHGKRRKADREQVQDAFMRGELQAIAATNAFGMGVDKPDIRWVVHRDIPPNLEAYYQEAGRAGRDGAPAMCTLIYRPGDLGRAAFLAGGGQVTEEDVERARQGLLTSPRGTTLTSLRERTGLGKGDLARVVALLKDVGLVAESRGRVRLKVEDFDPASVPLEREEHRRAYEKSRLDMMRTYAELRDCRRAYVLNYFGEEPDSPRCGRCDNCLRLAETGASPEAPANNGPFHMNERVEHAAWGEGLVQRVTEDSVTVLFEKAGYKTLATEIILQQRLLTKVA